MGAADESDTFQWSCIVDDVAVSGRGGVTVGTGSEQDLLGRIANGCQWISAD